MATRLKWSRNTFTARYRDASGAVRDVSTGCRDKMAAKNVLAELERSAELVKSGILTESQATAAKNLPVPTCDHIDAYLKKLEAGGTSPVHRANVKHQLETLIYDCSFATLADLDHQKMVEWMVSTRRYDVTTHTQYILGCADGFL